MILERHYYGFEFRTRNICFLTVLSNPPPKKVSGFLIIPLIPNIPNFEVRFAMLKQFPYTPDSHFIQRLFQKRFFEDAS